MSKTRQFGRGSKKKIVASLVSKVDPKKKRSDKVKPPTHTYRTRFRKDSSSHSETSPFKGFSEDVTRGKVKQLKLDDSLNGNKIVKTFEEEKCDPFDKLLNDDHKSNFTKNIKTYVNRSKKLCEHNGLVEFQDSRNRSHVIKWLNDTRNNFAQLTQSQSDVVIDVSSQSFDVPSVSQQNPAKNNQSNKRVRQSPYKLRARSLDIKVKKNLQPGRSKRHSFSGDTQDVENYNIEEVLTPIPAKEDAKIIIDLMEDEYLDNIEKELQQDKKNQSGWDRIKDINKTMSVKKPKQLNIVKRGSPPASNKKINSDDKNPTYDYNILENYFIENMEKLLDENHRSCSTDSMISNVLELGRNFVTSLRKLADTDAGSLNKIQPVVSELQNYFTLCEKDITTASTQTCLHACLDKYTQTESNNVHFGIQTESNCVHFGIQTESKCVDFAVQTESNLIHAGVQTHENVYVDEFVQTENDNCDIEVQVDDFSGDHIHQHEASNRTNPTPDIFLSIENEKSEISEALVDDFVNDHDAKAVVDENKSKSDVFNDDLDYDFDTEDIMKEVSRWSTGQNKVNEDVAKVQTPASVILVSTESNNVVNKGMKRQLSESPMCDVEKYRSKRPCAKFIDEDLSVAFSSQEEEIIGKKTRVVQFSEDSDDLDQCLANALQKYEDTVEDNPKPEVTPKTRTQEQIEELENIITNATRYKPVTQQNTNSQPKQTESPQKNPCRVEDDMDYFDTSSCVSGMHTGARKTSRRILFDSKMERVKSPPNRCSESLFDSERNNTVVANCTLTKDNVDIVMKEFNQENEMMENEADKEVEAIFERSAQRVVILDDVLLQEAHDKSVIYLDSSSRSSDFSDVDVVECTPQQAISSISKYRQESALDVTLPPPLEFQDSEKPNKETSKYDDDVSLLTPLRRPLAVVNKITSTPFSEKQDSEALSISPISFPGSSRKSLKLSCESNQENIKPKVKASPLKRDSTKNTAESRIGSNHNVKNTEPLQENKRTSSVYEMAQKQFSKFCPLTIVKRPQSQSSYLSSTPKQKSILNYTRPSQESIKSQKSESFEGSGRRKPCIACSRVSRDQLIVVSSMMNKKLATYTTSFTPKVTHLIVSVNEKNYVKDHTIKFVLAVASGIWVLNFEWIQQCLAKNTLVPEEPYEVLDVTGTRGPQIARSMRFTKPLLKGFKIYAAAPFSSTTRQEVEHLIRLLGGKVVPSPEHVLDKNGYLCVIVTEAKATQDFELYETWLEALKVVTVDMEWLSRSVGQYQLLSLRPFALCSDDGIEHLGYPSDLTAIVAYSPSQQTFNSVSSI